MQYFSVVDSGAEVAEVFDGEVLEKGEDALVDELLIEARCLIVAYDDFAGRKLILAGVKDGVVGGGERLDSGLVG